MRLVRDETKSSAPKKKDAPLSQDIIFKAREEIQNIKVSESAEKYIVDLIFATRYAEKYNEELGSWIDFGASPRGTISLDKCSRVVAWMNGRDFIQPDDVRAIINDVLRHRLILSYEANAEGIGPDKVIDEILKVVAVV